MLMRIKGQGLHYEGELGARGQLGRSPVAASVTIYLEHGVAGARQRQNGRGCGEVSRERTEFRVTCPEQRSRQRIGHLFDLDDVSRPLVFAPAEIAPIVIPVSATEVRRQELADHGTVNVLRGNEIDGRPA